MRQGIVVYLNGVTSAGKTSIAREIQAQADRNVYTVSHDLFQGCASEKFLRADYEGVLCEAIELEYRAARAMADRGADVVVDGMLFETPAFPARLGRTHAALLREIFEGVRLILVEVFCPLHECRRRNLSRGDRYETQSEEQAALMAQGIGYDLRVETHRRSAADCAGDIARRAGLLKETQ